MRDISLQFLDLLRLREIEVAHEPMSDPKTITFKLAKFSNTSSVETNEYQFHLRELNTLANLFVSAGVAYLDCATHTSKYANGQYTITLQGDVYGSQQSTSIYGRLLSVLSLYENCLLLSYLGVDYKAYVSSHNLYPTIDVVSNNVLSDSEVRHKLIEGDVEPKPVLDILTCSPGFPDEVQHIAISNLQTKFNTTCMGFAGGRRNNDAHTIFRVYLNYDYPCLGHPELLLNTAIGMYHCEHCGDMQLAGTFHLPKETAHGTP